MTLVLVKRSEAARRRFDAGDGSYRITLDFFGRSSRTRPGCEAFLIELSNRSLGAHFHPVDQFQIVRGGPGSMFGRTEVPGLMVHYADAFSTYGPITGGDPPLQLLTLRAEPTETTCFMPADRDRLAYRGRRNLHADPAGTAVRTSASAPFVETLFADESDGMAALKLTAPAGAEFALEAPAASLGGFVYVACGSLVLAGAAFGAESLGWLSADAPPSPVRAGDEGCELIVCAYPSPPTTSRHAAELEAAARGA